VRLPARPGERREVISVIGFPSDLRWVETMVTSLLVQLTTAMLEQSPQGVSSSTSAGWRRSFIVGFADTVAERLHQDRAERARTVEAEPARGSASLVLVEREQHVAGEFRRRFPHVRSSWASSGSSSSGAAAGRRAGREASLARGSVGGVRAIGPG
jgi:hypothetical protein